MPRHRAIGSRFAGAHLRRAAPAPCSGSMAIWTLERLFESPAAIVAREREKVAAQRREEEGGEADPPSFECRLCGYEWKNPGYCPVCLADTMRRVIAAR